VANSLFYKTGFNLKNEYLTKTKKCFETAIEQVDFSQAEAARRKINDWASNATAQKIPELIKSGVIGPDTRAILANAIYFKAAWQNQFKQMEDLKFYNLGKADKAKTVKFMVRTGRYSYSSTDDFEEVGIPYQNAPINMYIVKAKAPNTSITALESKLKAAIPQLIQSASNERVILKLPRFQIRLPTDLTRILGQLGLGNMFTNGADFSRMDPENGIKVSNVIHEAYIKVNENGTEAAAATASHMTAKMAAHHSPQEPIPFTVDYPFIFIIFHKPTETTLFAGKVNSIEPDQAN